MKPIHIPHPMAVVKKPQHKRTALDRFAMYYTPSVGETMFLKRLTKLIDEVRKDAIKEMNSTGRK